MTIVEGAITHQHHTSHIMKSYKYYHLLATDKVTGEDVIHFGSYDKSDVEVEKENEQDQLKSEGYKKVRIATTRIQQKPDVSVYGKAFCVEAEKSAI